MQGIRVYERPRCRICGRQGAPVYHGLSDRLFGVPGEWDIYRCPNRACGLMWLNPQPVEEDIALAYANYYTHEATPPRSKPGAADPLSRGILADAYLTLRYSYNSLVQGWWHKGIGFFMYFLVARRATLDFDVMYLAHVPGGRLLEIGCGSGEFLQRMQWLGWTVEGVDFDPAAVAAARSRGLNVHEGRVEQLGYHDAGFDAIVLSHVIEHLHDVQGLLRECRRLLRPNGHLVVVTPNTRSLCCRLFGRNWRGLEPPRHLYLFTPHALALVAKQAGLHVIKLSSGIRDAAGMFRRSQALKAGKNQPAVGKFARLLGVIVFCVEWAMTLMGWSVGEEIILIATKHP